MHVFEDLEWRVDIGQGEDVDREGTPNVYKLINDVIFKNNGR